MRPLPSLVTALVLMTGAAGCDWRSHVVAGSAMSDPEQTLVQGAPNDLQFGSTRAILTPRARYRITAYALITDDSMRDPWSDVASHDITFGWGPVASPGILRGLKFHLKRRYVSVYWLREIPFGTREVMRHLANHHLIPAGPDIEEALSNIRRGDLVTLEGDLVDVQVGRHIMRTSLSRDDVGNNACEVMYVESVEWISRAPRLLPGL